MNSAEVLPLQLLSDSTLNIDSLLELTGLDSLFISDSAQEVIDSLPVPYADDGGITAPIKYKAQDSIVYDINTRQIRLYSTSTMNFQSINLKADRVDFSFDTYILSASSRMDSSGGLLGKPNFSESQGTFDAEKIEYSFRSEKGKIYNVITQEGEGYIHSEAVKRNPDNDYFALNARYTTCDLEHPHFFFESKKIKVVPEEVIVSGPTKLVINDVPTPLVLPFGIFPNKKGRRSGVIIPEWGDSPQLGFFFKNGGYYFGKSPYVGVALTGDIYTRGSYALQTNAQYKVMYKGAGNVYLRFNHFAPTRPEDPDSKASNDFKVIWTHNQDPKARPNRTFTARLEAATRTYNQNNLENTYDNLETQLLSNIKFTRTWSGKPYSFDATIDYFQNILTGDVNLKLPTINFAISQVSPFKPKIQSERKKFYEYIRIGYNVQLKNELNTIDSLLLTAEAFKNLRTGIRQNVTVNIPSTVFKYFTLTPSFNYTDRWYFQKENRFWDPDTVVITNPDSTTETLYGQELRDTTYGFYSVRNYSFSLTTSTKFFGMYTFKGNKVKGIRHEITPSLSFSYSPDFGKDRFGYWDYVQSSNDGDSTFYTPYQIVSRLYGVPGPGLTAAISFNLLQRIEAKVLAKKDTANQYKKVPILDRFNISFRYDFAKDSLRMDPINITGNTNITRLIRMQFGFTLDPFITADSSNRRVNTYRWAAEKRFFRLTSAFFGVSGSIQSKKGKEMAQDGRGDPWERTVVLNNPANYYNFNVPWSLTFGYDIRVNRNKFVETGTNRVVDTFLITQGLRITGDFNLTQKWKFNISTGFDFTALEPTLTNISVVRDLHCWQMTFNWTAWPLERQSYSMQINVKSSVLQDMRLSRKSQVNDGFF